MKQKSFTLSIDLKQFNQIDSKLVAESNKRIRNKMHKVIRETRRKLKLSEMSASKILVL